MATTKEKPSVRFCATALMTENVRPARIAASGGSHVTPTPIAAPGSGAHRTSVTSNNSTSFRTQREEDEAMGYLSIAPTRFWAVGGC